MYPKWTHGTGCRGKSQHSDSLAPEYACAETVVRHIVAVADRKEIGVWELSDEDYSVATRVELGPMDAVVARMNALQAKS